jgi:hypothetical protein
MAFWKVWFGGRKCDTFNSSASADAGREATTAQAPPSKTVLRDKAIINGSSGGLKSFRSLPAADGCGCR